MKISECTTGMPVVFRGFITLISKVGSKKVRVTNTKANTWQNAKSSKNWVSPDELQKL